MTIIYSEDDNNICRQLITGANLITEMMCHSHNKEMISNSNIHASHYGPYCIGLVSIFSLCVEMDCDGASIIISSNSQRVRWDRKVKSQYSEKSVPTVYTMLPYVKGKRYIANSDYRKNGDKSRFRLHNNKLNFHGVGRGWGGAGVVSPLNILKTCKPL